MNSTQIALATFKGIRPQFKTEMKTKCVARAFGRC